jgi:hypothetical protein
MNPDLFSDLSGRAPIVLAATGHREIPTQDIDALRTSVNGELNSITEANPSSPCILVSALAEGADRLVAKCALDLGWHLCAALPLSKEEYETDFQDKASVNEFRDLLKRSTWIKVIDEKYHSRPICYHELGIWLSQHAQILIALWDGEKSRGQGGTAEVIDIFREGIPLQQTLLPEAGPVIQIQTRRILSTPSNDNFKVGSVRILPACPGGLLTEGEINRWRTVISKIDIFNNDTIKLKSLRDSPPNISCLPFPKGINNISGSKIQLTRDLFLMADALSVTAQRERNHLFMGLLGFSAIAIILSQIYSNLLFHPILLVSAVGFIGFSTCWYFLAKRSNLEGRYLDYRALAEACRVQYFWKLVGIKDCASTHYLREQRDELEWIRQALNTSEIGHEDSINIPLIERLIFVRTEWIDEQLNYFSGTSQRTGKTKLNYLNYLKWSQRSRLLFMLGMALTSATVIFHMFFADSTIPLHEWTLHGMIFGYCLLFSSSGLVKVYQETRAFSEHANSFQRMELALQLTRSRLDDAIESADLEKAVAIVRSLGIEALNENGSWLLMHRKRPVLVQGIG